MTILVDAIVSALSAGLAHGATDASKKVITDSYDGLKSLLRRKFGAESEAAVAIDKLEAKPDSEGRKQTLAEELSSVQAGSDQELRLAAQALLDLVHALPGGGQHVQNATGNYNAQAMGSGASAAVHIKGFPSRHE